MKILIGNCVSFVAALFIIAACIVKDKQRIYLLMAVNAFILTAASWFFESYAGMVTLFLVGIRNYLLSIDKFGKKLMIVFLLATVIIGLITNNRGVVGLIPVVATVQFTICSFYIKSVRNTKLNLLVNEIMWCVYGICIFDVPSFIADGISSIAAAVSYISLIRVKRKV